ncbi:hypothetical protein HYY72_04895 [Candidatus Woesearchaeota archaeon]|nr:hypothetical protein [Candidatus Woesearchaeota archaeon]
MKGKSEGKKRTGRKDNKRKASAGRKMPARARRAKPARAFKPAPMPAKAWPAKADSNANSSTKISGAYPTTCPNCKSNDISIDKTNPLEAASGAPSNFYTCNKCGNSGYDFPEIPPSDLQSLEKEDSNGLPESRIGKFQTRYEWKIAGPLLLLLGLFIAFLNQYSQAVLGFVTQPFFGLVLILIAIFMIYVAYLKRASY